MDFWTLNTSLRNFGIYDPLATPYHFLWSIWSFRDHLEVISNRSSSRNELWNPRYILKKIWYIQSLGYRNPYHPSHGPFVPLQTLGKWLDVVPHLGTDIETLGTSLRKFETSNPWANMTRISLPMVHLFLLETLRKWLEVVPHIGTNFGTLGTSFTKFGTVFLQNLIHP